MGYARSKPNGNDISLDDFGQNYEETGKKFEPTESLKKELNVSTYPFYLFIFQRYERATLIIKELLLNLLHVIFTNFAKLIKS